MQLQEEINDLPSSLSFSYYFSDSLTAIAAAKVSREFKQEQAAQFHEVSYVDENDFEFSMYLSDNQVSGKQIDLEDRWFVFPVIDSELPTKDKLTIKETEDASSVRIQVQELFVNDVDESSSSSSSEAYELERQPSGTFCIWWSKPNRVSSPLTKRKKSSSTGSRGRRWTIWNLLWRSNNQGKEPFLKVGTSKQKRNVNSDEVTKVPRKLKTASSPSFPELFYVRKRAEQKGEKMKTYLPYRQDLLGFFVNINRTGNKKSPF